jgi:galactoside O-acetyltransferase
MYIKESFYSDEELSKIGFRKIGHNVKISRFARFYDVGSMEIGNNVRIDDFCILSGKIRLGNYIHISAYVALYGSAGIELDDFSGVSPRCTIFSASDDFGGDFMIGPLVPNNLTNVIKGKVHLKKYVQIGAGSVIMPAVTVNEGAVVGAMSLVRKSTEEWMIYAGIPAKIVRKRAKEIIKLSKLI